MRAAVMAAVFAVLVPAARGEDPAAAVLRCQKLIESGNLSAAQAELAASLAQFPREPRLHNFSGVVAAQTGAPEAAEQAFRKAVELAPRFTGAWLNLGRLYQETGAPDAAAKALAAYRAILAYEPGHVEANFQAAMLLLRRGDYSASLTLLDRLPPAAAKRAAALALRCAAYAGTGQNARSLETARRLAVSPDLTEEDVLAALPALSKAAAQPAAIELLEALRKRSLASAASLRSLGLLYLDKGRHDEARSALEAAAASGDVTAPLLVDLARAAYAAGDRKGALGYLAHARDLTPGDAAVHFFFGAICLELGIPLDAAESFRKAVELEPANPAYNYALGAVLAQGKDAGEAVPYLKKYVESRKDDPHGRLALGFAYFSSAQYEPAKTEFDAAAQRRETAAPANYFLGRMALMEGDEAGALAKLEKALAADPRYADARAELGLYYMGRKDYASAERELRKALEVDPDGLRANLNLLTLYRRTRDPRAEAQAARFEEVQKKRWEKQVSLLRRVVARPE